MELRLILVQAMIPLQDVHPVSLDLVPEDLIAVLKAKYADDIKKLLSLAADNNVDINEAEVMRLFFVLQMSAFGRYITSLR